MAMSDFQIEEAAEIPRPKVSRKGSTNKTLAQERQREPAHETRAYDTYELEDVHNVEDRPWVRPTSLEAPPARPGFAQRWIRVALRGEADPTNTARRFREGWKPRPADTVPASYQVPTIMHGKWSGAIGVEGMLLCEMPKKLRQKRVDAIAAETRRVTNAIEGELQAQSRPGMEISQTRISKVVREVKQMADEE